jgi:UPF0271 protein
VIATRVHEDVDPQEARERVLNALRDKSVTTITGRSVPVRAETVCVHSDTSTAVAIAGELKRALRQ